MSGGDTIYALSSAPGRAGIAVLRLSGPAADGICRALTGGRLPPPRRASLCGLRDPASGELIDRGLVLRFPGPESFTGEDMLELHVHGGRAVLAGLFEALAAQPGARPATPGEFSRRAFVNARMELTEAEGLADLVAAETEAQRRAALEQADGALARLHGGWRRKLVEQLAHVEAWLDFPDEDLPDDLLPPVRARVAALADDIAAHLADARRGERLREGVAVAIIGAPNVGKSTLLNALTRRDAAIVSAQPGATRDIIETHLDLGGAPVTLIDTAGLREVTDPLEQEGVRRARARAARADIVLSLAVAVPDAAPVFAALEGDADAALDTDADADTPPAHTPETINLISQIDRLDAPARQRLQPAAALPISALTGEGLPELLALLSARALALTDRGRAPPTRLRHRQGLMETERHLRAAASRAPGAPPELLAEDLRLAVRALGRIAGLVDVEQVLDAIFRDFCIGK